MPKKTSSPCFFSLDRKVCLYYLKEKSILLCSNSSEPLYHHFRNIFVSSKIASWILDSMFFNLLLITNFWWNFTVIFSYNFIITFIVATITLIITTYYRLDNQKFEDLKFEAVTNAIATVNDHWPAVNLSAVELNFYPLRCSQDWFLEQVPSKFF